MQEANPASDALCGWTKQALHISGLIFVLYDIILQYFFLKQNSFNREYIWAPLWPFSSTRIPFVSTALQERGGELFEPIVSAFSLKLYQIVPSHPTRWRKEEFANKSCLRENKVCSENKVPE